MNTIRSLSSMTALTLILGLLVQTPAYADNTTVVNEPLVQERHEKVVVPTTKTTLTTTVRQEPAVVKTRPDQTRLKRNKYASKRGIIYSRFDATYYGR